MITLHQHRRETDHIDRQTDRRMDE